MKTFCHLVLGTQLNWKIGKQYKVTKPVGGLIMLRADATKGGIPAGTVPVGGAMMGGAAMGGIMLGGGTTKEGGTTGPGGRITPGGGRPAA